MDKPPRFSEEELYVAMRAAQRAGAPLTVEITASFVRIIIGTEEGLKKPKAELREVLKIEDLSNHWGMSGRAVRRAIDRGEIKHFRVGRLIRIRRDEVERIDREGGLDSPSNERQSPPTPYIKPLPDAFELGRRSRLTEKKK